MSGAGKSTVSEVFRGRGFSVIDCDVIAREAAKKAEFLAEIAGRFSRDMLKSDGSLNRPEVARIIYNDAASRDKYQRIIFPYIVYDILESIRSSESAVLLDAPTLFESKLDMICDRIVSVCAAGGVCAERIAARDNIPYESAAERLSAQHDTEFFYKRSDYVIVNDSTREDLRGRTEKIIDMIDDKLKGRQVRI